MKIPRNEWNMSKILKGAEVGVSSKNSKTLILSKQKVVRMSNFELRFSNQKWYQHLVKNWYCVRKLRTLWQNLVTIRLVPSEIIQTDGQMDMVISIQLADQEYTYFMGSPTPPFGCYIPLPKTNILFFFFEAEYEKNGRVFLMQF